ncbi:MAG: threonylcarbamoyl-AMP synthase [Proteobacteria bacterium]|nr:threonylcarbamoyl-AMP synthase [Pseudomonadota bacterium]
MSQKLVIHPENPQQRLILQAVKILQEGGVMVYPTDSAYALGCSLDNKTGSERIRTIPELDKHHHFTLICHDLSQLSTFAKVDNATFRILKAHTPGPYTFILEATKEVPRRLLHPKRKTIGLRVPNHPIVRALLSNLSEPIMSVTLIMPGESEPLAGMEQISEQLKKQVDLIIDSGPCTAKPTTVVDLTQQPPQILRVGQGEISNFL